MEEETPEDEDDDNLTRFRLLKANAARSETSVVSSGFVSSTDRDHERWADAGQQAQCDGDATFDDQAVGDDCMSGTVPDSKFDDQAVEDDCMSGTVHDSIIVRSVHVSDEQEDLIDIRDK